MKQQEQINYDRIAAAIDYIRDHFQSQPSLEEVAEKIHLSPYHFQRLFTDWAGVSPKKFLQYVSVEHAKEVLQDQRATVYDAAFDTGLSGTGRLHDLFVSIEGMTPGEFRNGGADLEINYSFAESPFGALLVASTAKGVCYMAFVDQATPSGEPAAFADLRSRFPQARLRQMTDLTQQNALYIFTQDWSRLQEIKLHLKGTDFQLKVWETLLKIPMGGLTTYKDIAGQLGNPQASRAVGSAVGDNPVAFLIPCHRVIQSTGIIGQYHWGATRKTAMIGWEAAHSAKSA
ncbi:MAG TPA: methylated-DNA--[protein]-cysteine S-methyltransferase [Puia sp.]|jgi:AraC family transcriptional regulator of adaptative response/methylated-DNA-[protein]-cysteine methyltransferase|nr:methylated-DNA--[protein]-cysteine S-methyltransferase [Puia sp.]